MEQVILDTGSISGIKADQNRKEIYIFRGIPYAAPPIGDLRWKPPQPVEPWKGIRQTTVLGKWATQAYPTGVRYGFIQESGMSEDCLYLNVLTPAKKNNDRLPVMVWFHGGGLWGQSGHRDIYNSPGLPQDGVVLVTVSHRLNVMGYMAHPALSAESLQGTSGNYGMLDLVAALKWVRNNIAAFGGDPDNVTIFGQSGGGNKVQWLMTSPLSEGLFDRAISQSGYGSLTQLLDAEQAGKDFARADFNKEFVPVRYEACHRVYPENRACHLRNKMLADLIGVVWIHCGPDIRHDRKRRGRDTTLSQSVPHFVCGAGHEAAMPWSAYFERNA